MKFKNRLKPIRKVGTYHKNGNAIWLYKCKCGNKKEIQKTFVNRDIIKSCGCLKKEVAKNNTKHGFIKKFKKDNKNPRFYGIWAGIKSRCLDKNCSSYKNYGARGINVSSSWNNFINFYNDMYKSYQKHCKIKGIKNTTLERLDRNKGYSIENCIWADYKIQGRNKRNNSIYIINGEKLCISQIIEKFNIHRSRFYRRLSKKLTIEQILADKSIYKTLV